MIRIADLQEAIAECQGEKNPNAQTCIKLAAYYTILNQMQPNTPEMPMISTEPALTVSLNSGSEFAEEIRGRDPESYMPLVDELVQSVAALYPAMYEAFMRELRK